MDEHHNHQSESAISVQEGIEQPPSVNAHSVANYKARQKKLLSVDDYVSGIVSGNRTILSKAITLIESNLEQHQQLAQDILSRCLSNTGKSIRIGITGVPGVGKSSFIEATGMHIVDKGHKLAVLAIDPSSERSGGSILGDKTRMEQLSSHANAFIRPSPTSGSLGGVARKTRETIYLCEAAGFDVIFIETVGVGQSETAVHSMVDFFLLLMLAGAGDELQGIKRGIMEMADTIAITKADGNNNDKALQAKAMYQSALHLFPPIGNGWNPRVLTCSALTNTGLTDIWSTIKEYVNITRAAGYFNQRRTEQSTYWMHQTIKESLLNHFYNKRYTAQELEHFENEVMAGKMSSYDAAAKLTDAYFKQFR